MAEKEYICSVEDGNQLCESDMNSILDVLSVSELREIWSCLRKKVGINYEFYSQNIFSCQTLL